ncbi:MAG: molybdenum cofactor biosynthesis protein MoaE [Bacteroidota bacterium]
MEYKYFKVLDIQLKESPLDVAACYAAVAHESAGGTSVFIGTVRNQTSGRKVLRLIFEAYAPMAIREMRKIAVQAQAQWKAEKMCIHHRTGMLQIGEIAVIIAVATPHRKAAFEACRFAIDALKERVPIWKKEIFEDGEVWVAAHP